MNSAELVRNPGRHDHFVQLYKEVDELADAVAEYVGTGLQRGEAAIVIATRAAPRGLSWAARFH